MASRMYIVSSMKSTDVTRIMPMPNARYESTAMPRLRPTTTEHVASSVTKDHDPHCVSGRCSPTPSCRRGTQLEFRCADLPSLDASCRTRIAVVVNAHVRAAVEADEALVELAHAEAERRADAEELHMTERMSTTSPRQPSICLPQSG